MSNWDESKHPRVPEGHSGGGQFTSKESIETAERSANEAAGLTKEGWR